LDFSVERNRSPHGTKTLVGLAMNDIETNLIETDEQTWVALRVALRSPKARFQRSQLGIEVASEATNEQA